MPSLLTTALLSLLGASHLASAHMDLMYPPPLKSKFNPFAQAAHNIDSDMTSPLSASGANFPCKGYQSMLGTPEGASVATFSPGGKYNLTIDGNAFHNGGSCQASLSYDKGQTFTVIQSWVGQCPTATGGSFDFAIPADAPAGTDVLFAWTWFNEVGNREMYMNCASVTIGGGSSKRETEKRDGAAFSKRPALFTANIGNGCGTEAGTDVIFPDPGPDVVTKTGGKLAAPTGTCQAAAGGGSGSGSGSSAAATATASTGSGSGSGSGSTAAPSVTSIGAGSGSSSSSVFVTKTLTGGASFTPVDPPRPTNSSSLPPSSPSSSSSSTSLPGGVFATVGNSASAAAPTTLATSTTKAPAASSVSTTTAAAPAGTGTGTGTGSSTGGGGSNLSGACTNEGAWNCIGGTSFQRCASGAWSAPMAMAAGTSCKPGVSDTLWRRSSRVRRAW